MKRLVAAIGGAALVASTGCFSHYSGGPSYANVTPPSGYAVVHVYRPKKSWGALQMIEASQPGRVAVLPSGGYATFVVPVGPVTIKSAINTWSQIIVMYAPGVANGVAESAEAKATETPVSIDATNAGVYFVRTEFTSFKEAPSAVLVDSKTGASEIDGLHLAAGGRGRYPVTPWTNSPPATSTAPPADAPK